MSIPAWAVPAGIELARIGFDALEGKHSDPASVARSVADIALKLMPRDELVAYLTAGGIDRADLAADIAEKAKFGDGLDGEEP